MELGKWNILRIDRIKEVGAYLTDGKGLLDKDGNVTAEDVLLPTRQIPPELEIGDNVRVFLYMDSEDRPIATTHEPLIVLGEIKRLKVKSVTDIGAFLDWGLSRDLFLPFKEQTVKVQQEKSYLVKLYKDKTGRLAASMKISDALGKYNPANDEAEDKDSASKCEPLKRGDHVKGVVYNIKKDFGAFVALKFEENASDKNSDKASEKDIEKRYEFVVRDNGIGISEEDQKKIFDEFFMVDKSRTRKEGGAGLGMSLVAIILEKHGATIRIESELGKGTSIYTSWPIFDEDEELEDL